MKCVILVAGKGTRMYPLTHEIPKPMLKINNKNLLEYKLDKLPDEIDEVIFVVGYLGNQIREFFKDEYNKKKITYIVQEKLEGTGKAIWCCKELLTKPFLVMMGDDIYHEKDILACIKEDFAIVGTQKKGPIQGGLIVFDENHKVKDIKEGIHDVKEGYINTGLYKLKPEFFNYPLVKLEGKEEWGLPQTLMQLAKDYDVKLIQSSGWIQVTNPDDLNKAQKMLKIF